MVLNELRARCRLSFYANWSRMPLQRIEGAKKNMSLFMHRRSSMGQNHGGTYLVHCRAFPKGNEDERHRVMTVTPFEAVDSLWRERERIFSQRSAAVFIGDLTSSLRAVEVLVAWFDRWACVTVPVAVKEALISWLFSASSFVLWKSLSNCPCGSDRTNIHNNG